MDLSPYSRPSASFAGQPVPQEARTPKNHPSGGSHFAFETALIDRGPIARSRDEEPFETQARAPTPRPPRFPLLHISRPIDASHHFLNVMSRSPGWEATRKWRLTR